MKLKKLNKSRIAGYVFLLLAFCFVLFGCSKPEPEEIKSVAQLLRELDNSDPKIRAEAALGFEHLARQMYDRDKDFETKKREIISALKKRLSDDNSKARHWAADALMGIASADNADFVIPSLIKDLEDVNPETRASAALTISHSYWRGATLVAKKDEATAALKKHLSDENTKVRYAAATALGRIDSLKFQSIIMPIFVEILNSDKEPATIYHSDAAEACKEIGPAAAGAVPALIELTKKKRIDFKFIYARVLKRIGTPEALEAAKEAERAEKMWYLRGVILNCAIILCYVLFFGWSVKLRKRGKKVFHWFLLVPIAMYLLVLTYNLQGDSSAVETILDIKFFLALAAIGCFPWIISWFILRRRESPGYPES